jgi:DNA-directed RNA polymerase subunit beta'
MDTVPTPLVELAEGVEVDENGFLSSWLVETTLGRALFNETLPMDYPFVNDQVDKKRLSTIVNDLAERYSKVQVAASLDALKEYGFYWATRSGTTVAISDVVTPPKKLEILDGYRRRAPSGAHRDLDSGHERGCQGDGGQHPGHQHHLPHGLLRCAW